MSPPPFQVDVLPDPAALAAAAAERTAAALRAAVDRHGTATWVLAGGTTPQAAYRVLAGEHASTVPWPLVWVVMGDERAVPPDHPDSNWGQARAALLDRVPLSGDRLLRPCGELGAGRAAARYEERLAELPRLDGGVPRLDVVWLGVGEDGHCLSLFPGRPELEVADRLVVPVTGAPKPPPDRVTLTLAALRGARCLLLLAAGAGKAGPVARALRGDASLPVGRALAAATAAGATVTVLLDQAAAPA